MSETKFIFSESPDPHIQRRKEMLKKYPQQIRALMGNEPSTALWVIFCVLSQFAIAYALRDQGLGWVVLASFAVGAFFNHALYVLIHDATHNLIFKNSLWNRLIAIFADFALLAPGSMGFRKYHLIHHNRQGQHDYDADVVSDWEAKIVGNSSFRKFIWVFLLPISQASRPSRLKIRPFMDGWIATNMIVQILAIALAYRFVGGTGLAYLGFSSLFGVGLHPMGGRWIAEHYVIHEEQETYSYYGPLNKLCFNVGHHNEHHDVMTIPWKNLPQLRKIAPEYYDNLVAHESYPKLLYRFIVDPKLHLRSRVLRKPVPIVADVAPALINIEEGVTPEMA